MLNKLKNKIRRYINHTVEEALTQKIYSENFLQIFTQMQEYYSASDDMLSSKVESRTDVPDLVERFKKSGATVVRKTVDTADFEKWMRDYPKMVNFYKNYGDVKIEKLLEHYLTTHYLNLSRGGGIYRYRCEQQSLCVNCG